MKKKTKTKNAKIISIQSESSSPSSPPSIIVIQSRITRACLCPRGPRRALCHLRAPCQARWLATLKFMLKSATRSGRKMRVQGSRLSRSSMRTPSDCAFSCLVLSCHVMSRLVMPVVLCLVSTCLSFFPSFLLNPPSPLSSDALTWRCARANVQRANKIQRGKRARLSLKWGFGTMEVAGQTVERRVFFFF